ncbi:MAG: 4-alpha-glucanotransferase [Spirochaetaceae bacterium]|nr:4-alpha-glucanotransferase [Spirochaetaceae bacterium]
MTFPRSAGILLHPTSLPGPYGIGTLGKEARRFIDFLSLAGIRLWQVLPLGPTGYGDSPYQSLSAFAGNPYLIDPDELVELGILDDRSANAARSENRGKVDFGELFVKRNALLDKSWENFTKTGKEQTATAIAAPATGAASVQATSTLVTSTLATSTLAADFSKFKKENSFWLDDFALFSAVKEEMGHAPWNLWPEKLKRRDPQALAEFAGTSAHADRIGRHEFVQFLFYRQWTALHDYARSNGIRIIGDIPIFVAYDSADTWSQAPLFQLDEQLNPIKVAGVPPDYFTATGQLWGNPLYDWPANQRTGYVWWIARIRAAFALVDVLRIDHFRGFESYWAVPAKDTTAANGVWEKGPGTELFKAIFAELGELPILAEDLGFMTPEVQALRNTLGFPGMKILQFAFESETDSGDYPHNYGRNCIVYTGTHDNDTSTGWFNATKPDIKERALAYTAGTPESFSWDMIRTAWSSPACIAVAPAQDLLGLGSEARMNYPGRQDGYWSWRMKEGALTQDIAARLQRLTRAYFRLS